MEGLVKTVSEAPKLVHMEEKGLVQAKLAVTYKVINLVFDPTRGLFWLQQWPLPGSSSNIPLMVSTTNLPVPSLPPPSPRFLFQPLLPTQLSLGLSQLNHIHKSIS